MRLVDADMRKPRVHEVFQITASPGLSNILVGTSNASESIQESSIPGLWIMAVGTHPPNRAELLGSERFKDFAAFLMQYFDWVIVDTPPVMAVTDSSLVANMAQGVLFVIGAEMTSRRVAQRSGGSTTGGRRSISITERSPAFDRSVEKRHVPPQTDAAP